MEGETFLHQDIAKRGNDSQIDYEVYLFILKNHVAYLIH